MATTPAKRACSVCGTLLADESEFCPVCALQQALRTQTYSDSNSSSELRFEHYTVLQNAEGKPFELGRGAMGVTYKVFDVHLQRPAALKIINAQLLGNEPARARFVREARAAASVRHQNVASVFHIGESGGNYYYAMALVEGESLAALIRRSGCLRADLALDIVEQATAGLAAIEKQHLVHRDIKPSNIMVSLQDGKLENVNMDARNDNTIWADSYDRDLTDIFAIQSEVAQTIAAKLTARLSAEEKRRIETKPTENLEAYDLYLRAKELFVSVRVSMYLGNVEEQLVDAIGFLEHALRLDPKFVLAYCASAHGYDNLYFLYRPTPEQRALADAAVNRALNLQPDLAEVHLAYAEHLYLIYRDYERAWAQLAIAMRGLPNDAEAIALGARIDRRQGQFEKAIGEFNDAITRDPGNPTALQELADTLYYIRRFRSAERVFDRLSVLRPDLPILKARKPLYVGFYETGDDTAVLSTIAALPASISNDRGVLSLRLKFALVDRDWQQAKQLIEKMNGDEDEGWFAYGGCPVPIGCYSIVLARLQGEPSGTLFNFAETREQLSKKAEKSSGMAALLLSQLAVVDAFLGNKEAAISEAKRAAEMTPISKDVFDGPGIVMNLAVVYAWTDEADLAFQNLELLTKMPFGIFYGQLKRDPYWDPVRSDSRFDKLLAELAPRD